MATLTREQILEAQDRKPEVVEVPEWGGSVNVVAMSALDRLRYLDDASKAGVDWRSIVVAYCAVDDQGARLFTPEDVAALSLKNGVAVERVFKVAGAINKLTVEAEEGERKNS